jgi:tripartite-type tricarboxylate transporter receptor subunit TctC
MIGRRAFGAGALALAAAPAARAAEFPERSIRFVIPYPPSGASDVTARLLADRLTQAFSQSVVVENRPGANGILACEFVAKAPADGYTLLMGNLGPNAINQTLYRTLPYDCITSFAPITLTTRVPLLLVVSANFPANTLQELIALAKREPNRYSFASAGIGSANHLAGEMLKQMAGIELTHVPYRGDAPAITDVIAGRVTMIFPTAIGALPHVNAGHMKIIGISTAERSAALPQIPTLAEQGLREMDAYSWGGVMAPAGTPPAIVARYHAELTRILAVPDVRSKLVELGAEIIGGGPDQFATFLRSEIDRWGAAVRASGARAE